MHIRPLRKNRSASTLRKNISDPAKTKERGLRDYVIAIAAVLSLLATFLTLAGFGASLAVEQFGIPHAALFGSTLDLLDLSCWVVLFLFEKVNEVALYDEYMRLLPGLFPGIAVTYGIFVVGLGCYFLKDHKLLQRWRMPKWMKNRRENTGKSFLAWAIASGLLSIVFWLLLPVIAIAMAAFLIISSTALLTAPFIGYAAGNLHIARYVVGPAQCEQIQTRSVRLKNANDGTNDQKTSKNPTYHASCVVVRNERNLYEQGRVVLSTTTAIFLYDPISGRTVRVPLKDAVIESVDKL
ncbi:hypothetical protein [Massilia sp. KIM]|uniref:hypothetical protein n=1 Tax=Massilia sp. KIM TaxID=1955422 RepID=UPI00117BF22E|nr:hypothetical protein [Massilia sp. KIM]